MLDDRLVEIGVVDLAAQRRVENLLLQHGVDLELGADLVRELFLRSVARRLLELREKPLHLAVVVDEQMGCVLLVFTGHLCLLISLWEHSERARSEEHTSELQSLMRISYAVFCLKKKKRMSTEKI